MELLQIATAYFDTKCDGQVLQIATAFFNYKVRHCLLQIATDLTKCDEFIRFPRRSMKILDFIFVVIFTYE